MADVLDLVMSTLLEDAAFNEELERWCQERCDLFTEEQEHKLEYTTLHQEFCELFEAAITQILDAQVSGRATSVIKAIGHCASSMQWNSNFQQDLLFRTYHTGK